MANILLRITFILSLATIPREPVMLNTLPCDHERVSLIQSHDLPCMLCKVSLLLVLRPYRHLPRLDTRTRENEEEEAGTRSATPPKALLLTLEAYVVVALPLPFKEVRPPTCDSSSSSRLAT